MMDLAQKVVLGFLVFIFFLCFCGMFLGFAAFLIGEEKNRKDFEEQMNRLRGSSLD